MIITRSAFPIILIFIYNVTCSAYNSQYLQDVRRIERGTYNFNHPPAFQYESVPVAVVYDEENISEVKIIENNLKEELIANYKNQDDKITTVVGNIELKSTESSVTEVVTARSNVQYTRRGLKPKGRTFNDYQIPVAVVYETEPRRLRSNKELSVKPKTRRQGQRKSTNKANVEKVDVNDITIKDTKIEEQQVTTEKVINKDITQRNEPATYFAKRTNGLDPVVPILESESYVFSHNGNFHYSYEGGDGTKAFERGELKTFDDDSKGETVVGSYSYTDKDGKDFSLSYTADENGYRPVGAHLPTPPPIPPAIARALKHLATKKPDSDEPVTKSYL